MSQAIKYIYINLIIGYNNEIIIFVIMTFLGVQIGLSTFLVSCFYEVSIVIQEAFSEFSFDKLK